MAQANSNSTTRRAVVRSQTSLPAAHTTIVPATAPLTSRTEASDPIFAVIDAMCAAEERHKVGEREAWHSYEGAAIRLLTTKPTTMAGVIAVMTYVALPECAGPGACETILDGARLSSNREAAAAAEQFPALSAEALREITGEPATTTR